MDFEFINNLMTQLQGQNIFKYGFTGAKALAFAFLAFRFFETYLKNFENDNPPVGSVLNVLGYGLIIMSGDWIMDSIESIFAGVDASMHTTSSDLYTDLMQSLQLEMKSFYDGCEYWYDYIAATMIGAVSLFLILVALLLAVLCKIADLSLTAGFLLQRVFIIQFLKFVFPLALAFSTLNKMDNLFYSWIRRYIGVFILGIAYIGIINFSSLLQTSLNDAFTEEWLIGVGQFTWFSFGAIITIIVVTTVKFKLFSAVTNYVLSYFS